VRKPTDKPRVERVVPFVRNSFFSGEQFIDIVDGQRRVETWCRIRQACAPTARPSAVRPSCSPSRSRPQLLPAPVLPYDIPIYANAKVHRDHHIEVAKALYSIPGNLIARRSRWSADRQRAGVPPRPAREKSTPPEARWGG